MLACAAVAIGLSACETIDKVTGKAGDPAAGETKPAPPEKSPPSQTPTVPDTVRPSAEAAPPPRIRLTPPPGVTPVTPVAILLPLSGPQAALGESLLNAAQMAVFAIADERMALLPFDTEGTPEGAAAAARGAVANRARLILGPVFGSSVTAVSSIARAEGVPVISFSNDRTVAGESVFIMGITPESQVSRVVGYAHAQGIRRLAAILPQGPFGDRIAESIDTVSRHYGLPVKSVLRYDNATTDAVAPLVRQLTDYDQRRQRLADRRAALKDREDEASKQALARLEDLETLGEVDFDAVLLPQGSEDLRIIAPLFPFYDADSRAVRMLGSVQWDRSDVATEPALFGAWFPAPPPQSRRAFETAYREAYGSAPERIASLAYDATALAAVLLRRTPDSPAGADGQENPAFDVAALTSSNGFAGVDGIFRLLSSGLVERGLAVKEVRDRRFVVIAPAPATFQPLSN